MKISSFSGKNLLGELIRFPEDLSHTYSLLIFAFRRSHQSFVDSWIPALTEIHQTCDDFQFYEIPTLARRNQLIRPIIDGGMKSGIHDPATRGRTVTVYITLSTFVKENQIKTRNTITLYLVSPSGEVLWQSQGAFHENKGKELHEHLT